MKVLILTHGSRGDVQPFVALARTLAIAGHDPILAAPAPADALAEAHGLQVIPLRDTMTSLLRDPAIRKAFETNYRGVRGKGLAVHVMRSFRRMMVGVLDEVAAVVDCGADLVVHHPTVPGNDIAELLGVPAVPACLQPIWIPTRSFPNPMIQLRLPRAFNRATYVATRLWSWGLVGNTAKWRSETLGLPRRRAHPNPLYSRERTPRAILQAFSRHVLPSPVDYPPWVHTTGFWFLPADPAWRPPRWLSEFLAAGEPPVYIGFGSMSGTDPIRTRHHVVEAIHLARVRAVVVTGWGGIAAPVGHQVNDVLYLDQVPFEWLFPRMSAIVHHGGSGTTGAALAAGCPQVICPFATEQPFYARRMHVSGLAPAPIPQSKLDAATLADAIHRALTDHSILSRAREMGHRIRAEDGATAAVRAIENLVPSAHS